MSIFILFVILQNPAGEWEWVPGGEYKTLAACEAAGNAVSDNWMCGQLVPVE